MQIQFLYANMDAPSTKTRSFEGATGEARQTYGTAHTHTHREREKARVRNWTWVDKRDRCGPVRSTLGGGVRIIKVRVAKVHGAYLVKQGEARQAREDTVALLL
jgi:hypothetical protein